MKRHPALAAILTFAACASTATPAAAASSKEEVAVIHTSMGDIVFRFLPQAAPGHVAYVKELIGRGFYDGTTFHRVIPHFVIQGGDPNSKDADRANDGEGEADRKLKAEFTSLHYRPGTVGMARDADPDSGSCQFFIALENLPRLDGKYTIFGEVISGLDVAQAIAAVPRDLKDNPLVPIPVTVVLKNKRVNSDLASAKEGPSGEVLTGPGKPKPWDPGDVRWTAPKRGMDAAGQGVEGSDPLDLSVDETGRVIDVRFVSQQTPEPAKRQQAIKEVWRFEPAKLEGTAVKCRFSTDGHGREIAPSKVPGTPVDALSEDLTQPRILVPVTVPEGVIAPQKVPTLRLIVDETGHVPDASIQTSCGDTAMDQAALEAARKLIFSPAMRGSEAVPVYLNVSVKWQETAGG
ncbi:MAG TPA: TonB family protein [Candidatus Polarisedimenticolia bacterium]|nr:TonB family protein [Candidatus Polarisedimenticolia bacterium]